MWEKSFRSWCIDADGLWEGDKMICPSFEVIGVTGLLEIVESWVDAGKEPCGVGWESSPGTAEWRCDRSSEVSFVKAKMSLPFPSVRLHTEYKNERLPQWWGRASNLLSQWRTILVTLPASMFYGSFWFHNSSLISSGTESSLVICITAQAYSCNVRELNEGFLRSGPRKT